MGTTSRTYDDPLWEITAYGGSDYPTEHLPFEIVRRTGRSVKDVRHAIEWPNRTRKLLLINGSPIYDKDREFDGMVASIKDVTEQIRMEQREDHLNSVISAARDMNQLLVREDDRRELIERIPDILVNALEYHYVWIALFDDEPKLTFSGESGLGEEFSPLKDLLKKGDLPLCARKVLEQCGVVVTRDSQDSCGNCPLSAKYANRGALSAQIKYKDDLFGMISASMPQEYMSSRHLNFLF